MKTRFLTALLSLSLVMACGGDPGGDAGGDPAVGQSTQSLCAQPNYLVNPSFQNVGPNGSSTTVTTVVPGGAGNSAAANWTLFTNTPGTIRTNLQPSTRIFDTSNMIHVYATGAGDGLVQVFLPFNSGPTKVISSAWIYVNRGQVGIGTGNGGGAGYDAFTTTTGQWQYIQSSTGSLPANEFFIYASSVGGADFYVDFASVYFSPILISNQTFATCGNACSTSVTTIVPGTAGASAAADWTLFTNNPGLITSELIPSTLPGGVRMIHVTTQAPANGLVQVFPGTTSCTSNGPAHTQSGAWVYVLSGQVSIGTGNGGNTGYDAHSVTNNQWEWVQANNGVSPANEFIVYASSAGGANYYVGFARVNEIP